MSTRVKVTPFTATGGFQFRDKTRESLEAIDRDLSAAEDAIDAIEDTDRLAVIKAVVTEIDQTVTLRGDAAIAVTDADDEADDGVVRVWFAATDKGVPSATNNTVAVETGTIVQAVTANAHYLILSDGGEIEVRVTVSGAGDRYVMAEIGGRVSSAKLEIAVIE